MKDWFKKIELTNHDALVMRMSDDENGEHVKFIVQSEDLTFDAKISAKQDKAKADKLFVEANDDIIEHIFGDLIDF